MLKFYYKSGILLFLTQVDVTLLGVLILTGNGISIYWRY